MPRVLKEWINKAWAPGFYQIPHHRPRGSAADCIRARAPNRRRQTRVLRRREEDTANDCVYPDEELSCKDRRYQTINAQVCQEITDIEHGIIPHRSNQTLDIKIAQKRLSSKQWEAAEFKACSPTWQQCYRMSLTPGPAVYTGANQ